jgi:hypothetical protein
MTEEDVEKDTFDVKQAAEALKISVSVLRRWFWKLDLKPADHVITEYVTKKGRRVGAVAVYTQQQVEQVRRARREALK